MGFFEDISDLIANSLDELLDREPDPERLIRMFETRIEEGKKKLAESLARQKRLEAELGEKRRDADALDDLARQSIESGDDAAARTYLMSKKPLEDAVDAIEPEWRVARDEADLLREQVKTLQKRRDDIAAGNVQGVLHSGHSGDPLEGPIDDELREAESMAQADAELQALKNKIREES